MELGSYWTRIRTRVQYVDLVSVSNRYAVQGASIGILYICRCYSINCKSSVTGLLKWVLIVQLAWILARDKDPA